MNLPLLSFLAVSETVSLLYRQSTLRKQGHSRIANLHFEGLQPWTGYFWVNICTCTVLQPLFLRTGHSLRNNVDNSPSLYAC